jgi:hypothetical protein
MAEREHATLAQHRSLLARTIVDGGGRPTSGAIPEALAPKGLRAEGVSAGAENTSPFLTSAAASTADPERGELPHGGGGADPVCLFGNTPLCGTGEDGAEAKEEQDIDRSFELLHALLAMNDAELGDAVVARLKELHQHQPMKIHSPFVLMPDTDADSPNMYDLLRAQFIHTIMDQKSLRVPYGRYETRSIVGAPDARNYDRVVICRSPRSAIAARLEPTPEAFRRLVSESVPAMESWDRFRRAGRRRAEGEASDYDGTSLLWYCPWRALRSIIVEGDTIRNVFQIERGAFFKRTELGRREWSHREHELTDKSVAYLRARFMTDLHLLKNLPPDYADCRFDACRPVSCYLMHPAWEQAGYEMADAYGNIVVRLRNELKERCTFTAMDSMQVMKEFEFQSALIFSFHYLPVAPPAKLPFHSYVEAQIWGGRLGVQAIQEVWIDPHLPESVQRAIVEACSAHGIPVHESAIFADGTELRGAEYYGGRLYVGRIRKPVRPIRSPDEVRHVSYLEELPPPKLPRPAPMVLSSSVTISTLRGDAFRWLEETERRAGNGEVVCLQRVRELAMGKLDRSTWRSQRVTPRAVVKGGVCVIPPGTAAPLAEARYAVSPMPGLQFATRGCSVVVLGRGRNLRVASVHLPGGAGWDDTEPPKPVAEYDEEAFVEFRMAALEAAVALEADVVAGLLESEWQASRGRTPEESESDPGAVELMRRAGYARVEGVRAAGGSMFYKVSRLTLDSVLDDGTGARFSAIESPLAS